MPLIPLGAQEELKDVLAQHLRHELGFFKLAQSLVQAGGQILISHCPAFAAGELVDIVLSWIIEFVAFPDSSQTGCQEHRITQVRVHGGINGTNFYPAGIFLSKPVGGHADQRRAIRHAPGC